MSDIQVENYKKSVTKAVDRWREKLAKLAKKLEPIDLELDKLEAIKEPSADDKKRIAELLKARDQIRKDVNTAGMELRLDVMLLEIPAKADEKELLKLPAWLKEIIKAKGIPLGDGVSIAPDVSFDFKAMKLKYLGIIIKW
jgi:hypothetical protein